MIAIWKFVFHDLGPGSPPGDLQYSNVSGISGYSRKILNFGGINLHCDLTSKAIPTVNTTFEIEDIEAALDVTALIDGYVTISVESDETPTPLLSRAFKLKINSAVYSYGTVKIKCESDLGGFENSKFPPYHSVKAIAPQIDEVPEDLCIPYTIGKAYIPIYPILINGDRRYLLGKASDVTGDFTITKVRSPRDYGSTSYWDDTYTYNQENKARYGEYVKITDMIIARSTPGGVVDFNGIFQTSGKLLSPLIEYEGDVSSKHPGAFILDVLQKAGISNCDSSTFTTVDSTYFSGVNWSGGFWKYKDLEVLVSELLSQCDCYLTIDDKINLNAFDSSSVETFDKSMILENSFAVSAIRPTSFDGGIVKAIWANEPEDVLTAEIAVGLTSSSYSWAPENPDTSAFEYRYGINDDGMEVAQKFGILHFQKKHTKTAQISFSSTLEKISTRKTIVPGQVINIDDDVVSTGIPIAYSDLTILIYDLQINTDLSVEINGYAYDSLDDFSSVSANVIYPEGSTNIDIPINVEDISGDDNMLSCVDSNLYAIYGITPTGSGEYALKANAKSAAFNLWYSLGDTAKWEPWNGAAVTTNHTWTGDTGDFSIVSEALSISLGAGGSKSISLSGLSIHAEDLRVDSSITLTGSSASTYCRVKITDNSSTIRYFYLGNADPSWVDDTDEFLIGSGVKAITLANYGLSEIITDISIQCAVDASDTSTVVSIEYIDFEYCHDLFDECAACSGDSPPVDSGAYAVSTGSNIYAFYFDACISGNTPSTNTHYNKFTELKIPDRKEYTNANHLEEMFYTDYEMQPWETVYVDLTDFTFRILLPQESDYDLKIGDRVKIIDYKYNGSVNSFWACYMETGIMSQFNWGEVEANTDGAVAEFEWVGGLDKGWMSLSGIDQTSFTGDDISFYATYFSDTFWAPEIPADAVWDGFTYTIDNSGSVYLDVAGTWNDSYDPPKMRITFTGGDKGGAGTFSFILLDGNGSTIGQIDNPISPVEIDLTFLGDVSITQYMITKFKVTQFNGVLKLIEFYEPS